MKKLFFLLFWSFCFVFCSPESKNEIWMTYHMTQCADPWQQDADYFNQKEATLKKFLEKEGVVVKELKIITDCSNSAVCAACVCLGCDVANVLIDNDDIEKMEKLKFTKK